MITIVASFVLKTECIEAFKKAAEEVIKGSRSEEGNVDYTLYQDISDPNNFFFIENWKDENAIAFHNATEHFKKFTEAYPPMLAKELTAHQMIRV